MSTVQKAETTCNPCDSVVAILVNKDTICGDGGKSKVDNQTVSYNDKGELQWGVTDNYGQRKFNLEVSNKDTQVKVTVAENIGDTSCSKNVVVAQGDSKIECSSHIYTHGISENVKCELDGRSYDKKSTIGAYMYSDIESVSSARGNNVSKDITLDADGNFNYSVSGSAEGVNKYLNMVLTEVGSGFNLSTSSGATTKSSISLLAPIDGVGKLQVDDKNVVRSINGVLANEAGELPLELNVLTSADGTKFRLTASNEGLLELQKIQ